MYTERRERREKQRDDMYQEMKIFIILFPFVGKRMTRESDDDEKTMKDNALHIVIEEYLQNDELLL